MREGETMTVVACPECGRLLTPWEHDGYIIRPHCWHGEREEVVGKEMTLEKAITLARWHRDCKAEELVSAQGHLDELLEMR